MNVSTEAAPILAGLPIEIALDVEDVRTNFAAGGLLAFLVYRYLGLKFVSRSWFNLDASWAFSLVLVGALSLAISLASRH